METKEWRIVLRSKYTGEEIHLGSRFNTREQAEKYAEKECCSRCNSISIKPIYHNDMVWVDKHVGFVNRKRAGERR
jgi:hypothetical protein